MFAIVICLVLLSNQFNVSFRPYRDILHFQIVPDENNTTTRVVWTASYE